jgi:hypothetical protein
MKDILKNCKSLTAGELKILFFDYFSNFYFKEAYIVVHFMFFKKMDTSFITNDIVEKLKLEIET